MPAGAPDPQRDPKNLSLRAVARTLPAVGTCNLSAGPASLLLFHPGIAPLLRMPKADHSGWHRANVARPPGIERLTRTHATGAQRSGDARSVAANPQPQRGPKETPL